MEQVEIIARETLKPSSPTPQSLRNFNLCLIDQLTPPVYASFLFFYSSDGHSNSPVSVSQRSQLLKKSFTDTLTLFYPFAGRLKDNIMIDCTDYGAVYVEARVGCTLLHVLQKPERHELTKLMPIKAESTEASMGGFLSLVQVTSFDCGGVAIGLSLTHKLSDGNTVRTFMKCWAAMTTLGTADATVMPVYNGAAHFPPRKLPGGMIPPAPGVDFPEKKLPKKRFVFNASKVAALKAAAASANVERPTRAESVSALIWKCALKAARSKSGLSRQSLLSQVVNIRRRVEPPLSGNSVGNLIGFYCTHKDESEIELQGLVRELREGIQVFDEKFVKMLQKEDGFEAVMEYYKEVATLMSSPDLEFYLCTSLCNISLMYDIDFGWRKPVWVTIPLADSKNLMVLNDTNKGDGSVEAWVFLSEQDMDLFERDPEFLAYASLNPSVMDSYKDCV